MPKEARDITVVLTEKEATAVLGLLKPFIDIPPEILEGLKDALSGGILGMGVGINPEELKQAASECMSVEILKPIVEKIESAMSFPDDDQLQREIDNLLNGGSDAPKA